MNKVDGRADDRERLVGPPRSRRTVTMQSGEPEFVAIRYPEGFSALGRNAANRRR